MQPGTYLQLTKHLLDKDKKFIKTILYMNMVGSLQYVADCTRPDIMYTTGQLAKYLNNLDIEHYQVVKHYFQYLKGTSNYWLKLSRNHN